MLDKDGKRVELDTVGRAPLVDGKRVEKRMQVVVAGDGKTTVIEDDDLPPPPAPPAPPKRN